MGQEPPTSEQCDKWDYFGWDFAGLYFPLHESLQIRDQSTKTVPNPSNLFLHPLNKPHRLQYRRQHPRFLSKSLSQ